MTTSFYADVLGNGDVHRICQMDDPDVGPPQLPDCEGTAAYLGPNFTWNAPSTSCRATWPEGAAAIVWVETESLAEIKAGAIAKPYADIDAVVRDAVGNRTEEYKDAEADARAYRATGYAGTAPPSVGCYALHNPTGSAQTGQWAADDIIARADAFAAAKLAMRENRFASQFAIRAATTSGEVDAAVAGWASFIAQLRAQLGLPGAQ